MPNHSPATSPSRLIPEQWLAVARVGWLLYALLVLTIHLRSWPGYLRHLQTTNGVTPTVWEWPTVGDATVLQAWGIALPLYAAYMACWAALFSIGLFGAGLFVFWRRSHEVVAWLVALALVSLSLEINATDNALTLVDQRWVWPNDFNQMVGATLLLWIGYLFPDGRYQPPWTKWLAAIWGTLNLLWFLFSEIPFNHVYGATANRTPLATFLLVTGWFLTGTYAQFYRYRHMESAEERAQIRWILLGFLANFIPTTVHYVPLALFPQLLAAGAPRLLHLLIAFPLANLAGLTVPLTLTIALLRYRLWLVDPILNRALLYTLLTAALTAVYLLGLLLVRVLLPGSSYNSTAAIVVATAVAALLLAPIRNQLQSVIDRTFQRAQLDVQAAFTALQQEIRTLIALPELLERLVVQLTTLLRATNGVIYLADAAGAMVATSRAGTDQAETQPFVVEPAHRQQLAGGEVVKWGTGAQQQLLVPLTAPQTAAANALVGVLRLGRRHNGQPYSRADLALLAALGAQAGAAIAVAQLVAEEQARNAWRNSAAGQAAMLATDLPTAPALLVGALHTLATQAHSDLGAANTLRHLADAFEQRGAPIAAALAQGYAYLAAGAREPALLVIGLRTLVTEIEHAAPAAWPTAAVLRGPLTAFLQGLQAESVAQISAAMASPPAQALPTEVTAEVAALLAAHGQLQAAVAALQAFSMMTRLDDQLELLVQMLDRLTTLIQEPASPSPIRTMVQRIAEHWTVIITRQAATLRRQAQLVAKLVTQRLFVPTDDAEAAVTVLLALTNQGRGQATDIVVALVSHAAPKCTAVVDAERQLARLIPGESARVAFTLSAIGLGELPLRFVIRYCDEEVVEQQVVYQTVIHLLPAGDHFQPIANPYVAGAPLRPKSTTFVGRQRDLQFVRERLVGGESNVALVLTGARRMGKTSLLQQLLVQLAADYAPVYLDCQALAIETGLDRLLFDVAEAIAFATGLPPPDVADFADRPSHYFARAFLPQVQAALGERRLLLLFDEFEELELRVDRGRLEPEFFPYLRHLVQHGGRDQQVRFAVLFAGAHPIEDLNPAYWSAFFNVAHHRRLAPLAVTEARQLITAPVAPHLHYDDLALDQMVRLTGSHPYFLQLLCFVVVNAANHEERSYVTLTHVRTALEELFDLAASHLRYLWDQAPAVTQPVLCAAATVGEDGAAFTAAAVGAQLMVHGVEQTPQEVEQALRQLVGREFLQILAPGDARYRFTLELQRLWIIRQVG